MKKTFLFLATWLVALAVVAQTVVIILVLTCAAAAGGMLIWVMDKNASQVTMRWVILERRAGGEYISIETNRVPVAPEALKDLTKAFPSFFVVATTNSVKLYRVRLAEDWEIPNGFTPVVRVGAEAQPILYDPIQLQSILSH